MWHPVRIEIEQTFARFVESFRGGILIDRLLGNNPAREFNADYLFDEDAIIAELKCLVADPSNPISMARRYKRAFDACGYSGSELLECVFGRSPIPVDVAKRVESAITRSLVEPVKKANKQIRASKRTLSKPNHKGLLLVANDDNHHLQPAIMMATLASTADRLEDCHVDCVVYFSPNVYHDRPGSNIAWTPWIPSYRDDEDEQLSEFVNELGRAWSLFVEAETGDPAVERVEYPDAESSESLEVMLSTPVRLFDPRASNT